MGPPMDTRKRPRYVTDYFTTLHNDKAARLQHPDTSSQQGQAEGSAAQSSSPCATGPGSPSSAPAHAAMHQPQPMPDEEAHTAAPVAVPAGAVCAALAVPVPHRAPIAAPPAPPAPPAPAAPPPAPRITLGDPREGCWIQRGRLPPQLQTRGQSFDQLWELHPVPRGRARMMGKEVEIPRWHQAYMHDYRFTGVLHRSLELPPLLQPFLDWANACDCVRDIPGGFNSVMLNWYQNGNDYIGPHSDDESELVAGAPILSMSLGQERTFRITRRTPAACFPPHRDFSMPHGSFIVMGGRMQSHYKHAVPKVGGRKGEALGRRINIVFRMFRD